MQDEVLQKKIANLGLEKNVVIEHLRIFMNGK